MRKTFKKHGNLMCGTNSKGFTLLEVLIALGIVAVISIGIYGMFIRLTEGSARDRLTAETQQQLRTAVDFMTREIRMAGLNPSGNADAGITDAQLDAITFTMDINGDGDVNDAYETITYAWDSARHMVTQQTVFTDGNPAEPVDLIENVSDLQFYYYDVNNPDPSSGSYNDPYDTPVSSANLDNIAYVEIVMEVTIPQREGKDDIVRNFASTVRLRNHFNFFTPATPTP